MNFTNSIKQNRFKYLVIFIMIVFLGCGKKVEKSNADFIGSWEASDGQYNYSIIIGNDSQGKYSKCAGILTCETNEGKARIKGDELKIGAKSIKINTEPLYDGTSGLWTATLDGQEYTKY